MQRLKRQSSSHKVSGLSSSPGPPPRPPPPSLLFFLGDILFTIFITRSTLSILDVQVTDSSLCFLSCLQLPLLVPLVRLFFLVFWGNLDNFCTLSSASSPQCLCLSSSLLPPPVWSSSSPSSLFAARYLAAQFRRPSSFLPLLQLTDDPPSEASGGVRL